MKKIFVGNLSWKTTEEQLKAHFEVYGQVLSAKIVTDKTTGRSKGFGFVEMANASEADGAISGLDGREWNGRALKVNEALPKGAGGGRPSGGGGFGGGGKRPGGGGGGGGRRREPRW